MRIDRLTSKLQLALSDAQSLAVGLDHPAIEPAHLMQALLEQQGGSIKPLLMQVGFDVNSLRKELTKELDQLPKIQNPTGDVNMSQDLARLLNQADRLAQQKGDQYITSEVVLLAAMDDNSKLGKLLLGQGVSKKALENALNNLRDNAVDNVTLVRLSAEELTEALNEVRPFRRLQGIDLKSYEFGSVFVDPPARAGRGRDPGHRPGRWLDPLRD